MMFIIWFLELKTVLGHKAMDESGQIDIEWRGKGGIGVLKKGRIKTYKYFERHAR